MQRTDSFEKTLMLGKIEGRRRSGRQKMSWLDGINNLMDMSLSTLWSWWWTGKLAVLQTMGSQRVGYDWETEVNWCNFQSWPIIMPIDKCLYLSTEWRQLMDCTGGDSHARIILYSWMTAWIRTAFAISHLAIVWIRN